MDELEQSVTDLSTIAESLDFVGRKERQRKPRIIEIDDREDRDGLTRLMLDGLGYTTRVSRLPLGDYRWESRLGLCVLERKTPADITDIDRLSGQVSRLRAARGGTDSRPSAEGQSQLRVFPILLIDHRNSREDPWRDADLDNLLVSVCGRIRIAHTYQGFLATRLDSLYRWSQKSSHGLLDTEV